MSDMLKEYKKYLEQLDLISLKKEATYIVDYLNDLIETYNGLINFIGYNFVIELKRELVHNSSKIEKTYLKNKLNLLNDYLNTTVNGFINNRKKDLSIVEINSDFECSDRNDLYKDSLFNYSLIHKVFKPNDKEQSTDFIYNIYNKNINYSWYDVLNRLYNLLSSKLKIYFEDIKTVSKDNIYAFTNDVINEVVRITEEYSNSFFAPFYTLPELLDSNLYYEFIKYDCIKPIIELFTEPPLFGFDFGDFRDFMKNTIIVKIVSDDDEIILSKEKPNKLIVLGFDDCETFKDINKKILKYRKECINEDCDCIAGNGRKHLVIYLLDK